MSDLILASQSAARAGMLRNAGLSIETSPARIDEAAIKDAMRAEDAPARDIADKLAEMKAQKISPRYPGQLVLGADQVLVAEGALFDKPADRTAAEKQLATLSGKTHHLVSAAVLCRDARPEWRHVQVARLTMRPLSTDFIAAYLDAVGDAALSSVGAYQIEGRGAQLFSTVEGDYFTILGLPLLALLNHLRIIGVLQQ